MPEQFDKESSAIPRMRPKLPAKTVRGLQWIHSQAAADYAACADERGTGQFAGTSSKEVADALDWLNGFIQGNVR